MSKDRIYIEGFDENIYLETNPDVKEAVEKGSFKSASHHLEHFGLQEIERGVRKFHKDLEPYNEETYLEYFPEVNDLIKNGEYISVFEHFCKIGYAKMIHDLKKKEEEEMENNPQRVVAVLGIPRSGLTLGTSALAGNCNASAWFLPYATRKHTGLEAFQNIDALKEAYREAFPTERNFSDTLFISETTADEESMSFVKETLLNLQNSGTEVHVVWFTRNIHHTFISQVETAHKYWGADEPSYTDEDYQRYIDFAKRGYLQMVEVADIFDTTFCAYEKFLESPHETLKNIYDRINIESYNLSDTLQFENKNIAGDPSFSSEALLCDRPESREEKWLKISYLDDALEPLSRLFVDAMQERLAFLKESNRSLSFNDYKTFLLKKHFDSAYYLSQYDDIKKNNIDPLEHYVSFGWKENRDPHPEFETKWYRENIFDDGQTPPFLHFLLIGRFLTQPGRSVGIMENLKIIDPETYVISDDLVLEVPKFDNPKVSIIIPAYNEEKYSMACIQSIIENTDGVSYEIIFMDDKSPDESARLIERNLRNVKFISNGVNYGFLKNCNKGATFAVGEYILFLNNDTNVQPGWLSTLVDLIESSDDIGMVGSRLVYPTGQQQEAGGIVWNDASGWNFGRLDDPNKPEYNYVKEADYLTGAAMMIRTSLWKEIGGFDERYVPAYYEDTDLAFEARKHGYRTLYQPKSVVIHFEGISNGTDLGSGIKKYQVVNKENFFNKWKDILENEQFPNAHEVFLARDRSAGKRHLLYVDHYLPHYDQDAGSKATFQYLKILAENNIQVHFVGDNFYNYPDTPYLDALQQMGIEVLHGNWYAEHFHEWFKEHGKYFDYAVLSRPHIAKKYIDTVREYSSAKIIYMGHDLHFLREQREYQIKGDKQYLESSKEWQKAEMELIQNSDVSYFFSDVEKEEIQKIDPKASVDVVPLYIYDHFKEIEIPVDARQDIMFVGGFAHSPNVDAMLWFVSKVWPKIIKKLPDVKLYIIGSKPPKEIEELASDSIIVTGYVDDETLNDYYKKCRVVVAPLRYGAGIKGKIVDALYNGMPLVTTSIGAEGLQDSDSTMLIADKPKKFAKHVVALYTDDDLAQKYAENALAYCKKYFSTQMAKSKMSHIFKEFKENK